MYRGSSYVPKLRMRIYTHGRGAFCKPVKVCFKACWRYQKSSTENPRFPTQR
uniref:Uncharacterized protein n=1 Tax=Lepeophtheirus salmonis TaxID=72036 RepID=A0A0K2VLN4_LEPSM